MLLNKVKLDKILFIGYADAIPLINEVIKRKFETLESSSPNFDLKDPIATVFTVNDESNKEIQHIIDILIEKAMV